MHANIALSTHKLYNVYIMFLGVYSGLYFRRIVQNKRWFIYFHTLSTDDFYRKVRKRDEKNPQ